MEDSVRLSKEIDGFKKRTGRDFWSEFDKFSAPVKLVMLMALERTLSEG